MVKLDGLPDLPEPPEELKAALKQEQERAKGIRVLGVNLVRATWSDALIGLSVVAFFSILLGWLMYFALTESGVGPGWALVISVVIAPVLAFLGCGLRLKRRF